MLFGYFLVENGIGSMETILTALKQQREKTVLARKHRILSAEEAYLIPTKQREEKDLFGAVASELELLILTDVTKLLRL